MSDSVMMPLGEICRNASRRFSPPQDGKVWFINTGDVDSGSFNHNELSDWEGLPGQAKKAIVAGDILYSEIRPGNGRYAFVDQQYNNAVVSTKFMVIEAGDSILPKYLYHVITSPELQNAMKVIAETRSGTFPQITFDSIAHLELMVPPKPEQLAVCSLLDAIDSRIRNNQKMNQNLEELAKAIFRSWFVEFDPVRAKIQGRPTGLPSEISDLFPDEFVDLETGEVPKGWVLASIDEACEKIFSGGTPSTKVSEYWNGTHKWLSSGETGSRFIIDTDKTITEEGIENSSTKAAQRFDTVIASAGQGKTRGQTSLLLLDTYVNQSVVTLRAKTEIGALLLFFNLARRYEEFRRYSDSSSSRGSLTTTLLKELPFVIPTPGLTSLFSEITHPMVEKIEINLKMNQVLSDLRDSLLPKLISGELRIPDAEKFLEETGI